MAEESKYKVANGVTCLFIICISVVVSQCPIGSQYTTRPLFDMNQHNMVIFTSSITLEVCVIMNLFFLLSWKDARQKNSNVARTFTVVSTVFSLYKVVSPLVQVA